MRVEISGREQRSWLLDTISMNPKDVVEESKSILRCVARKTRSGGLSVACGDAESSVRPQKAVRETCVAGRPERVAQVACQEGFGEGTLAIGKTS